MQITDLSVTMFNWDGAPWKTATTTFGGHALLGVVTIQTDEGVEGHSFLGSSRQGADVFLGPLMDVLKPMLIGRNPLDTGAIWTEMWKVSRIVSTHAIGAVDVALWDIAGKQAGVPVYKLLGTQRYETEVYATYPPRHESSEGYVREAKELLEQGFRAYKIHPGVMSTRDAIETVERVRAMVGDDVRLMFDPNGGYGFRKAFDIGKALDANGCFWYEDPVPWHDFDAISELSRRLDVPLCMSDSPELQFQNGAHMVRLKASRLVRGTARKLGITGLKKLCSLAEGFGMNCGIGTAGNSLLNAANLHVIFSVANCDFFEYWMPQAAHQFGLVDDVSLNERNVIEAPEKPGLGYELDWDYLDSHKIATLE